MFGTRTAQPAEVSEPLGPRVAAALGVTRQLTSDRVLPAAEVARDRLAPVVNKAADAILDAVLPAVTAAAEAYENNQRLEEIRRRGEAAVTTLRTEAPAFARRRWPLILALVVGGGAIGAGVGILIRRRTPEPGWTPLEPAPAEIVVPAQAGEPVPATEPGTTDLDEVPATGLAAAADEAVPAVEVVPVTDPARTEATRSEP